MRITLLNQKGGVGKSTIALHLAAVLKKAHYDIAVEEQDPQGSSNFLAKNYGVPTIKEHPDAEYVIVDTPGRIELEGEEAQKLADFIKSSDVLIVVTQKDVMNLHGTGPMVRFVKKNKRKKAKAYLLFNDVEKGTNIGKQDIVEIARELGLPTLKTEVPHSVVYKNSQGSGLGAVRGEWRKVLVNLALEIMK